MWVALNHVHKLISSTLLILGDYMKLLQKPHPLVISSLLQNTLGLKIVQWLVICVDNGFLSHHKVLPLHNKLNRGIQFLIIGRVVCDSPMKHLIMISYWITYLHKKYSHGIPNCIYLHFEMILQVRQCENWYLTNFCFSSSKYFWRFPTGYSYNSLLWNGVVWTPLKRK